MTTMTKQSNDGAKTRGQMSTANQQRSRQTEDAQSRRLQRLIRALREIEKDWPEEYWLFAAAGTLTLMTKKDGKRVVGKATDGMDPNHTVETFRGIECDGGDW